MWSRGRADVMEGRVVHGLLSAVVVSPFFLETRRKSGRKDAIFARWKG